jgi:hypothetical protein
MTVTYEGECCDDCICFLANGDCGTPERTAEIAAAIEGNWSQDEVGHMCANCDEDCEGQFSWRPCEACGSTWGGGRHKFAVLS